MGCQCIYIYMKSQYVCEASLFWGEKVGWLKFDTIGYMGVSKNRGTPKWMVYNGKPY